MVATPNNPTTIITAFMIHMAKTGVTMPRPASDSPPMSPT